MIYTYLDRCELHVSIHTNNKKYDDALMDILLDIEYPLHNLELVGDMLLVVTYLPMVLKPNVHPMCKLIYEKEIRK